MAAKRTVPGAAAGRRATRAAVDPLRAICLALPETTEKVAWGEPTWRVRGRLFAQLDDHHHGADRLAVCVPAAAKVAPPRSSRDRRDPGARRSRLSPWGDRARARR